MPAQDGAAVLNAAKSPWDITGLTAIPVATVYWNGSAGAIQEERHDAERNLALHEYLHKTVGARIPNDGSFAQTRPSTANDGQLELVAGSLWDEDIENPITTAQGKLVRNWYETSSGVWTWADGTANSGYDRPYLWNSGTSRLRYPNSGSAYALTDCADNRYIPVWVYASNDIGRPIYVVTPALATTYTTVANARAALAPVLPFAPELKLLYRWIYRGDGEYQEAADYRTASSLPSGGVSTPVAASIAFAPSGDLVATNVQAMGEELDDEKYAKTGGTLTPPTVTGTGADSGIVINQAWSTSGNPNVLEINVTGTFGNTAKVLKYNINSQNYFSISANTGGLAAYGDIESINSLIGASLSLSRKVYLRADDTSILAQHNSTSPQESRLYGSYTSATNYHRLSQKSIRQAITAAAGATLVSTISIPKYSHLIGVTTRVTTALGTSNGTTGYTVGDGTDPDLWGVAATATEGTTTDAANYTAADALGPDGSDRTITLTAVGGNFDGTGVIEVCAFYLRAEAD